MCASAGRYLGPKEGGDPVLSPVRGFRSPVRSVMRSGALARQPSVQRLEHHSRAMWVGANYLISLKLNFSCKVEMKME